MYSFQLFRFFLVVFFFFFDFLIWMSFFFFFESRGIIINGCSVWSKWYRWAKSAFRTAMMTYERTHRVANSTERLL